MSNLGMVQDQLRRAEIERERQAALREYKSTAVEPQVPVHQPVATAGRSKNVLRPSSFDEVIGQQRTVGLLRRIVAATKRRGDVLDHLLFVAASGLGKSTLSHVLAAELGVDVFEIEAPVSHDTLMELRETMKSGDILRIEEIHMQGSGDRRSSSSAALPEILYAVMEDRVLQTPTGVMPFPAITIIGTTTDEGLLPDAFINRFPLRPHLEPYAENDMVKMAHMNAEKLHITLSDSASRKFARASRGVPREMNNHVKNAARLSETNRVNSKLAMEVLHDLSHVTEDGLSRDMQAMLLFLYQKAKSTRADGEIKYQASVNTIATVIGKSRDSKAIALRVEPWLIQQGYVQVGGGGRFLTDAGVKRAQELERTGR